MSDRSQCYCETIDVESLNDCYQCRKCEKRFHTGCLKRGKPSPLEGDQLFEFICCDCSHDGEEQFTRMKLQWVHVVTLTLYNLHLQGGGKCGYFRWREHICNFIDKHWSTFFGYSKKKTTTWQGTVAGTLSAGCPRLFISGASQLKETGWWTLTELRPPSRQDIEATSAHGGGRPNKKGTIKKQKRSYCSGTVFQSSQNVLALSEPQAIINQMTDPLANLEVTDTKPPSLLLDGDGLSDLELDDMDINPGSVSPVSLSSMPMEKIISDACGDVQEAESGDGIDMSVSDCKDEDGEDNEGTTTEQNFTHDETFADSERDSSDQEEATEAKKDSSFCWTCIGKYEERLLLKRLQQLPNALAHNATAKRLKRKLIVRQVKRERNVPLFDLDEWINTGTSRSKMQTPQPPLTSVTRVIHPHRVLDRYQVNLMQTTDQQLHSSFITKLVGRKSDVHERIISPYTARVLQPYIWKDFESKPLKLRLLEEIANFHCKKNPDFKPSPSAPIDYCYVQPHHIPSINAICRQFFWKGIDLSESLHYPDFSCVALYKKVVIGFAFMVPDVKYNEAYISFVFTHPEWRNAGIATFMLYHLIQTCMGKDVTLHVSATNPALLLYQKFGFKVEEFIVDFYDKYFPEDSNECRHAMFLRLSR